ncbi:MAG: hypothetical protein IT512_09095 [Rhodocyclaceae bacterium]|nr:hypothetical protein [Rhodocyclaceae bacterium]
MRYFFVERLQVGTWLTDVWPRIRRAGNGPATIWYVEGSAAAESLALRMAARAGTRLKRWTFDAARMFDEEGTLIWMRTHYGEMLKALSHILRQPDFDRFLADSRYAGALKTWTVKLALPGDAGAAGPGLWRAIYLIHVALWFARRDGVAAERVALYLRRWPWMEGVRAYGAECGLEAINLIGREPRTRSAMRRLLARDVLFLKEGLPCLLSGGGRGAVRPGAGGPNLAVQYYGHFNLDRPECYSDFFFWQQSDFPPARLVALFGIPQDPLDGRRMAALARHGLRGLAIRHGAACDGAPVQTAPAILSSLAAAGRVAVDALRPLETGWLDAERTVFRAQKRYWKRVFSAQDVKVFVTWFKYNADHCVIGEALRELGGALALYQRSYEGEPTAKTLLNTDIYFGFSRAGIDVETQAGSRIDHFVTTGYLGDHRFRLVQSEALRVREALHSHGAKFILAYFDEAAYPDANWGISADRMREHYAFVFESLLRYPDFGLVLKPKTPAKLRQHLGPVCELLDRAVRTDRCYVYDDGVLQGSVIPAQAALSADLAVHGSLVSGTAACEAALAGVPTVLLDDDGWTTSPLCRLDAEKVVFKDWNTLWHTWLESRTHSKAVPGFADWSTILDELDPFRDGRAAERMGMYLKWLVDGFAVGQTRERVLAIAAERYCAAWGEDKVATVRPAQCHTV